MTECWYCAAPTANPYSDLWGRLSCDYCSTIIRAREMLVMGMAMGAYIQLTKRGKSASIHDSLNQ